MKIALNTVDLFPGRERLMPYRTLIEVAKVMNAYGWEAHVLNSPVLEFGQKDYEYEGVQIVQAPRDFSELSKWVNEHGYDVFFFPSTIRDGLKNLSALSQIQCRKIAYVPSGITPLKNALYLFKKYGMFAKAWVLEAIAPKTILASKLKKAGFTDIIGLTEYTTKQLGNALNTHTIYPGKDGFEDIENDYSIVDKNHLRGEKFYLFSGAPRQVRGGLLLLKAFDKFVEKQKDAKIVFLMRNDVGAQYDEFFAVLNGMKHKDHVLVLRDKLTIAQLKAFMEEAYAVVLPFICIPAEVPITYYEVMSCGTPVVSFPNAGTTEYLHDGLCIADGMGEGKLMEALEKLWSNPQLRAELAKKGKAVMNKHPRWEEVGKQWIKVIKG